MPQNSYAGMSRSCSATYVFCSENGKVIHQNLTSSPNFSQPLHYTTLNLRQPTLACPVSGCSLVFKGEIAHGYLWRHLKRPGLSGRTGTEKIDWLNLHKVEHDRLLATRITPAQRKHGARKAKAQKLLRAADFELRARNMGIMEKSLIVQKVVIWEGMYEAEQSGDSIGWVHSHLFTAKEQYTESA
ncbi:hypothetical protein B9Z19DRAFT_1061059 [Tuber borchii]|uniref:Uncharacterized protein n=1 Tax=Tuber borchii TaxID=42251 RepID=A0A2T7A6N0_TUBBO|nr:hypothetical protein B9Z19DRAFT_1061059 [Tuber borchii]